MREMSPPNMASSFILLLLTTPHFSLLGKNMVSIYEPTRDANELIDLINEKAGLIVIGHSLGGFTALNISRLRKDVYKTVCMSAFISKIYCSVVASSFVLFFALSACSDSDSGTI